MDGPLPDPRLSAVVDRLDAADYADRDPGPDGRAEVERLVEAIVDEDDRRHRPGGRGAPQGPPVAAGERRAGEH